jgi:hypothetical protein
MLETVYYPDEPPVTYKCPLDKAILEYLKYELNSTIRGVYAIAQEMLMAHIDPIVASGEVFELGNDLRSVPPPNAKLNVLEAWEEAKRHAKCCEMLLENEADSAELVLGNSIRWAKFWSVRASTPELREMFTRTFKRLSTGKEAEDG